MAPTLLTKGSPRPGPVPAGKVRLYSNYLCPYAQRIRIVLKAKNVPHEVVDIDLLDKPEWYPDVNPASKVPALETGSEIVVESLDIADFLDEKYPLPPLYSSDPVRKAEEKKLIENYGKKVGSLTLQAYQSPEGLKSYEEATKEYAEVFISVLKKRGTKFFNGSSPGIVEYMLWPALERYKAPYLVQGVEFKPPSGEARDILKAWKDALLEDPAINETLTDMNAFVSLIKKKYTNP